MHSLSNARVIAPTYSASLDSTTPQDQQSQRHQRRTQEDIPGTSSHPTNMVLEPRDDPLQMPPEASRADTRIQARNIVAGAPGQRDLTTRQECTPRTRDSLAR